MSKVNTTGKIGTETEKVSTLAKFEAFTFKNRQLLYIILAVLVIAAPFVIKNDYITRVAVLIGIYTAFAMGLNMLTGQFGIVSLGHAGFVGIGAYTCAILVTKANMQFLSAAPIAAVVAGLFGLLLGLPTLRLTGTYLTIATLGFGEVMRMIFLNWESMTGGAMGIKNIPKPNLFGFDVSLANGGYYFMIVALLLLVTLFCRAVINSKYGRAFKAIKGDELASRLMGVNTTMYKVLGFVISAMICGLVGAFYAMLQRFIDQNTFTPDMSILILSIIIVGGMGTIRGLYLGAFLLLITPEVFRFLQDYRFIVYGLALVLMMRFRPSGLLGWRSTLPYRYPKGTKENLKIMNVNINI